MTTNGDGDVTANTYDGDQLASTTVGYGTSAAATTSYTYDENGNIASITDPDGNVTEYTYDADGNVLTTTNQLGTTTNTYDADGNLISTVDADGRKITYAYDSNRLVQQVWFNADGTVADTQTYTYDEDGNMLTASNSAGTYTYTYDDNQLSTQTDPNGLTLSYGYDEDGNLTTVSDSQGGVTSYVYDGNQVVSKTYQDATTQLRVNFTYDHDDNVLTETRYSDLAGTQLQGTTQYGYDGNQLTSIVQTDGSGNTLASYSYSYDAAGQLSSETDNGVTTTYVYNATGELIQAGSMIYAYDANGNPIQTGTVIGPNNELLSDGTWNYTYDAAGNQIGKVNIATGETWTYVYNDANQMISAVDVSAGGSVLQQETNTYDVFGQRIGETETTGGSTTTQEFSYDTSGTLYADLDSSGTITTRYISSVTGPDEWLARVDATGGGAWLLSDHLGSVRTVVSLTGGNVLDQIGYDAVGNIVSQTNAVQMGQLGFQGGQFDPITVTYNFGERNYNPGTGTWTTQDPDGLSAGSNSYEFDDDDPSSETDPTGLEPQGWPSPRDRQAAYADLEAMQRSWATTALGQPKNFVEEVFIENRRKAAWNTYQANLPKMSTPALPPPSAGPTQSPAIAASPGSGSAGGEEFRRPVLEPAPTYNKTTTVDLPPPMSIGEKLDQLVVGGLLFLTPGPIWTGVVIADTGTAISEGEGISPVVSALALAEGLTGLAKVGGNVLSKSERVLAGEARAIAPQRGLASTIGGQPIDAAELARMKAAFEKNGGVLLQNADVDAYLLYRAKQMGASNVGGLTDNAKQILLPTNATRTAVFEEFIHTAQYRTGRFNKAIEQLGFNEAVRRMEIEAAEKLIANQRAWRLPQDEIDVVVNRLQQLRAQGGN